MCKMPFRCFCCRLSTSVSSPWQKLCIFSFHFVWLHRTRNANEVTRTSHALCGIRRQILSRCVIPCHLNGGEWTKTDVWCFQWLAKVWICISIEILQKLRKQRFQSLCFVTAVQINNWIKCMDRSTAGKGTEFDWYIDEIFFAILAPFEIGTFATTRNNSAFV